jgi:hypothetical protein
VRQHDVPEARQSGAPSISAASSCSLSSDWIAVSRISVANGSHCQETIMMIDGSDAWLSHSTGWAPKSFHRWANRPFTGIHEHVLPDQRRNRRHDEERRDDQDTDDTLAPHRLIEQHGQQDAENDRDQQDAADDDQRGLDAGPERTGRDEAT